MSALPYTRTAPDASALGLIVLQSDETIEMDFRRLVPKSLNLLTSRVPSGLEVSEASLSAMEGHLKDAATLFPRGMTFAAVGYGCTSGTSVIGPARIADQVMAGVDTKAVTEPVSALIAACHVLGIQRLGILSPYVASVSIHLRRVLASNGIETPVFASFDEAEEAAVARIDRASVIAGSAHVTDQGGIDALFLSCTNLRTLNALDEIEATTGLPVLTSNLVLAWHMTQLAGANASAGISKTLDRLNQS